MSLKHQSRVYHQNYPKRLVLLIVCLALSTSCGDGSSTEDVAVPQTTTVLQTEFVQVNSPNDIIMLVDSLVAPRLYSNIGGLDSLPLDIKKRKFVSALLPAILVAKDKLYHQRQSFKALIRKDRWTLTDSAFYKKMVFDYRSSDTTQILSSMKTHPNSIVLAQAAIESGWGNSRIFEEANNLFGIWSYNKSEPRIPAAIKREGKTIYLRKYKDVSESISDYFRTLGRSRHYSKFRKAREASNDVNKLIPHLINYSERKEAYIAQLRTMIRYNELRQYDNYKLDSAYYKVVTLDQE